MVPCPSSLPVISTSLNHLRFDYLRRNEDAGRHFRLLIVGRVVVSRLVIGVIGNRRRILHQTVLFHPLTIRAKVTTGKSDGDSQ